MLGHVNRSGALAIVALVASLASSSYAAGVVLLPPASVGSTQLTGGAVTAAKDRRRGGDHARRPRRHAATGRPRGCSVRWTRWRWGLSRTCRSARSERRRRSRRSHRSHRGARSSGHCWGQRRDRRPRLSPPAKLLHRRHAWQRLRRRERRVDRHDLVPAWDARAVRQPLWSDHWAWACSPHRRDVRTQPRRHGLDRNDEGRPPRRGLSS
jgi:hypothetical protein